MDSLTTIINPLQFVVLFYLLTRRFNQDALENFFGNVRNQIGNSYNPTPIQFYYAFKKLFSVDYDKVNDTGNTAPRYRLYITSI